MYVHDLEYSLLPCDQRFWKQREPVNQNGSQVKGCHFLSMQINTFCGNAVNTNILLDLQNPLLQLFLVLK